MKQFLIQSTGIRVDHHLPLLDKLIERKIPWVDFGTIPFTQEMTGLNELDLTLPGVVHGGTKLLEVFYSATAEHSKVFPALPNSEELFSFVKNAVSYDMQRFDQAYYSSLPELNDVLLNSDAITAEFNETLLNSYFTEAVFIKPGTDQKFFAAGVIENMTLKDYLGAIQIRSDLMERKFDVVIAPVKRTLFEWRFYIINDRIATASQYFCNGSVKHNSFVPQYAYEAAEKYKDVYKPHAKNYVMDIALTENKELKIVEYNCINCSGLYHCDLDKYIDAFIE